MEKDYFNLLVLPLPRTPEVEAKLAAISRETNIDLYTLRERFFGKGPAVLKRTADRVEISRIALRLEDAGYAHLLFSDSEFRALFPARRALTVRLGDGRVDFLNGRGEVINSLSRGEECLLAAGDLGSQDWSARQMEERVAAPPAELLESVAMGEPVLDICPRKRPPRVRIFGKNFNYASLGDQAGPSAAQNLLKVVGIVQSLSSGSRLDLSFGFSAPPPIGGVFLNPTEIPNLGSALMEKLQRFENHSRALGLVFENVPVAAEAPVETGPAASSPVRPAPPVIPSTGTSRPSSLEAGLNRVRAWGPPAVIIPMVVAGLLLGGGYFYTRDLRLIPPVGGIAGLLIFFHGFVCLRRARRIESIPTSRIRSLPMGTVEVSGQAQSPAILKTPFTLVDCVWYQFLVEEYRRAGRDSKYVAIARGNTEDIPFYVEDETGKVLVDSRGALVEIKCRQVTYQSPEEIRLGLLAMGRSSLLKMGVMGAGGKPLRITEVYIPWKHPVYVIGTTQSVKTDPGTGQTEILNRLRELKKSPEKLAAFDLNRDGRIDNEEWERARAAAEQEVLVEKLRSPITEEQVFVGRGEADELFLISDRSERQLLWSLKARTLLGILGGGGIVLAVVYWGLQFYIKS
ncbi:MAG: GIDE domain-containing protein [bacterium]|nr:GIDE domain-containing protein [bacterium]